MADRAALVTFLDDLLNTAGIEDSSNNGLQVEGVGEVTKVGLAVDASMEAYHRAADAGCQMLIVHHGLIWGGLESVTGSHYQHVKMLVESGLNLYASHLPLDLHAEHGNNAELARLLGLKNVSPFGTYRGRTIGFAGECVPSLSAAAIARKLADTLDAPTQILPFGKAENCRIGVVSGGAGDMVPDAIAEGLDCYVTGEPAHQAHHKALEGHINVVFCGHYHSETLGVRALGTLLATQFGVQHEFLDIPTLV